MHPQLSSAHSYNVLARGAAAVSRYPLAHTSGLTTRADGIG